MTVDKFSLQILFFLLLVTKKIHAGTNANVLHKYSDTELLLSSEKV